MLYQKLLSGEYPYKVRAGSIDGFQKHRHPEIEIAYCLDGSYDIVINNTCYNLKKGDLAIIGSMVAHEYLPNEKNYMLVIEVGPVFLSGYFNAFVNTVFEQPVITVHPDKEESLYNLLKETNDLVNNPIDFSELTIKGNLYKICASILRAFEKSEDAEQTVSAIKSIVNIDKALELIYKNYKTELTVEYAAEMCGYSKSNFCKIFKKITGDTFHNVLNNYRIKMACQFLKETTDSVESIATEVGFSDAKTLCRVFKVVTGQTTGAYRRNLR